MSLGDTLKTTGAYRYITSFQQEFNIVVECFSQQGRFSFKHFVEENDEEVFKWVTTTQIILTPQDSV